MATELTETFFENVNRFMRENNLSKPKIALKLGGSKALFYTWENRKIISDTYLRRICDLMGTTKKMLLGGSICQKKDDAKEPQPFIKCIRCHCNGVTSDAIPGAGGEKTASA
jgi:hypothetical protein